MDILCQEIARTKQKIAEKLESKDKQRQVLDGMDIKIRGMDKKRGLRPLTMASFDSESKEVSTNRTLHTNDLH